MAWEVSLSCGNVCGTPVKLTHVKNSSSMVFNFIGKNTVHSRGNVVF
jgi:hypothetical protein